MEKYMLYRSAFAARLKTVQYIDTTNGDGEMQLHG